MTPVARPGELIDCGDFVLRRWREREDFEAALALIEESLEHLRPWETWVAGHDAERTRGFLARSAVRWDEGEVFTYALAAGDGRLLGMCQAYRGAGPRGWRLGYWLHPAATGRGFATRAAAALAAEMFTLPGVEFVEISHDLANTASAAVPRRLGFTELGRGPAAPPVAPAGSGTEVVWRLDRPPSGPGAG
ncbi:GNAT family N-acetyltransferase [Kitasatospora sp. NPDC015120]|uniref:GNAT family N-acetyltransferase n=1 Tax=Kitasatospora sp. NPDC015120 TaxID=3364023 RepID=UPI0036F470BA